MAPSSWTKSPPTIPASARRDAGGYVEVAPARRGRKKLDTSRLSVYFGEEGMRRAAAAEESERETEAADGQG
ncbi:hypothetical protein [Streptomyces rishiriensis]|uniref:hypothetical protein n=1 Tax=Streptomyces rishiriensis TaxID=68264 RepID=UPI00131EFB5E|nr:hypothetical protein [Streptomyces rishiriensis]